MSNTAIFDLDQLIVNFLGIPINGFGEGGAVKIEKVDPTFKVKQGMGGDVIRTKTGSKLYKVTITALQGTQVNAFLSTTLNLDEASPNGAGVGPLTISDVIQGTSLFVAGSAWIEGPPPTEFANEGKDREWVLYANDGTLFVGSN